MSLVSRIRNLIMDLDWLIRPGGLKADLVALREAVDDLRRMQLARAMVLGHTMTLDPDDDVVSRRLGQDGIFESLETELVANTVQPGETIVDVGANIGYYTLQFARLVGESGHVYAFEPDSRNFELLARNVSQNGYQNVTLIQKAVSDQTGTTRFYRNPTNLGDHRIYDSGDSRECVDVSTVSLDEFFGEAGPSVDFVKVDVQGAEASVLRGMTKLVERNPELRIVSEFWPRGLHLAGDNASDYLKELSRLGFDVEVIDESTRRIAPLDAAELLERLPIAPEHDLHFTNLFCRKTQRTQERIAA